MTNVQVRSYTQRIVVNPAGSSVSVINAGPVGPAGPSGGGGGGDMTAAEILAALLTVDGAGSGLDADLLDGTNLATLTGVTNALDTRIDALEAAGSASTGSVYFMNTSELVNTTTSQTQGTSDANRVAIQAKLDAYETVYLPEGEYSVSSDATTTLCIGLNAYNKLIGMGRENTKLKAWAGSNQAAVIGTKNFGSGSGTPDVAGRQCEVRSLGVDGNWKHPTTGALRQTSGLGHGIALCGYQCRIVECLVILTAGDGIHLDTSNRAGTALGESIENYIAHCEIKFVGKSGIAAYDTGSWTDGGVSDGRIIQCEVVCWNTSNSTDEFQASGIFVETSGGWEISGNHLYGNSSLPSSYSGYGNANSGHGINARNAYGTRIHDNQVADFGASATAAADGWSGIIVQGYSNRGFVVSENLIWHDKDRRLGTTLVRAMRINTIGGATGTFVSGLIVGNVWNQREGDQSNDQPPAPVMEGLKVVETSTGTFAHLSIIGNVAGYDTITPYTSSVAKAKVHLFANSWQNVDDIYLTAIAYAASITPNCDTTNVAVVGTLTGPLTVNAPTGVPVDGQNLRFKFVQDATGRVITWNAAFAFGTDITSAMVPTTASAKFEVMFTWDATSSKWRCMAIARGF